MIRNKISDDMVNMVLRQMGALSIKTSPAHINIAKFEISENTRIIYMYEVKEEEIYLQRISPCPMMIGKVYNEQQVVDLIGLDLQRFKSAYNSRNFSRFLSIADYASALSKELENLFMCHNVEEEQLKEIEETMQKLHRLISKSTENSPVLKI